MVNKILVERGYAEVLMIPPNGEQYEDEFEALEQAARDANAGSVKRDHTLPNSSAQSDHVSR